MKKESSIEKIEDKHNTFKQISIALSFILILVGVSGILYSTKQFVNTMDTYYGGEFYEQCTNSLPDDFSGTFCNLSIFNLLEIHFIFFLFHFMFLISGCIIGFSCAAFEFKK